MSALSKSNVAELIEKYAAQQDAAHRAMAGLSREQLGRATAPGAWSVAQLVWHLMDSDLVASDRMRRVIAMERPLLLAYDENAYARSLGYERVDPTIAADLFRLNRRATAELLRTLPAEAFGRTGVHSERGVETLADVARMYTQHVDHHMTFAMGKRKTLGV